MYVFDLSTLIGWLTAVYRIIVGVLRLDPAAYNAVFAHPDANMLTLAVLLIVGLSISIGNSVVLFVNRVERKRFILSFAITSVTFVIGVFGWSLAIWITAIIMFDFSGEFSSILRVVGLSFAPFIFGIFILLPYLGYILEYMLRIWALLAALVGIYTIFDAPISVALFSGFVGWVLFEVISNTAVLQHIEAWAWRKGTGTAVYVESPEAIDLFIQEIQTAVAQSSEDSHS